MVGDVTAAGATLRPDEASIAPIRSRSLRNAMALARIVREQRCDVIHAHARAPGWSAYYAARRTGIPFLTSWYKGFREQNVFKRLYNGVMARGDCVVAISDQIAELVVERYNTPWDRITVIPASVDFERFDPARVSQAAHRRRARSAWGVRADTSKSSWSSAACCAAKVTTWWSRRCAGSRKWASRISCACSWARTRARARYFGELWDLVLATGAPRSSAWPVRPTTCRLRSPRDRRGQRRDPAGRAATGDPGSGGHGEARRRVGSRRRAGRRAGTAGRGRGPHDRASLLLRRFGGAGHRPGTAVLAAAAPPVPRSARAGAPGCWRISTHRPPPSRLFAFMRKWRPGHGLEPTGTATHLSARRYPVDPGARVQHSLSKPQFGPQCR